MSEPTSKRVLSLMQPTADSLHLGNYLGALKQWVSLQEDFDCFFGVADLHALNEHPDPQVLRERTLKVAAQYLAAGVDPRKATIFVQSHVPSHTQLQWVLSCYTGFGQAQRMTQFKDKATKRGQDGTNLGLFTYPVLMAADILLHQVDFVPVGQDQKQHLELTRDLAERFNGQFPDTFVVPQPYIIDTTAKIQDLQDPSANMSKSASSDLGLINMLDDPAISAKKIKSAVTDSESTVRYDPQENPGVSNLMVILSALTGEELDQIEQDFTGQGYGALKSAVADAVVDVVTPFRQRATELLNERTELEIILAEGAEKARHEGQQTLDDVYQKVGFLVDPGRNE